MTLKKAYYGDYEEKLRKRKKVIAVICVALLLVVAITIVGAFLHHNENEHLSNNRLSEALTFTIPEFSGEAFEEVNGNVPFFSDSDLTTAVFESYSPLDRFGRCGPAYACLGRETMPTEERGAIGMVKPSGWHTVRYDDLIEDKYLYNRCHLIAFMLSGENTNENNLITGTRYLNVTGMLPYENATADYIRQTGNHVMYRVTPCFEGNNLVASGVLMEAKSVEDNGTGLSFNVFVFNVQPGIVIDYSTGDSKRE